MTPLAVVGLLALSGLAAYVQTLTGFALGLVLMGAISLTGLIDLPDAAVLVSVLTLTNATQVLARSWQHIVWPAFALVIVPSLLFLLAGYALLEHLAGTNLDWLRLILASVIIASSIQLLFRPHPLPERSPAWSFVGFGAVAGLMGGLFSTSGPPLVYHFYRQPLAHRSVRETLVLIFAVNAILRLVAVTGAGRLPPVSTWWMLIAIPAVAVFTFIARTWPPPVSQLTLRRGAFLLLLCSGLSLGLPALSKLTGVSP